MEENTNYLKKQIAFAIFCIENLAIRLKKPAENVYLALTGKDNILENYIISCYDFLHTQSKDYIIDDILETMENYGVVV